jgi:hypothetical protein
MPGSEFGMSHSLRTRMRCGPESLAPAEKKYVRSPRRFPVSRLSRVWAKGAHVESSLRQCRCYIEDLERHGQPRRRLTTTRKMGTDLTGTSGSHGWV